MRGRSDHPEFHRCRTAVFVRRCTQCLIASIVNPYEASQQISSPNTHSASTKLRFLRLAVYVHLVAILGCALLTLSDMGQLKLDSTVHSLLWAVSTPLVLSWMICPGLTMTAAWKLENRSNAFRGCMAIIAILMSVLQLWVCLPLVQ